jgi:hypothetical protein
LKLLKNGNFRIRGAEILDGVWESNAQEIENCGRLLSVHSINWSCPIYVLLPCRNLPFQFIPVGIHLLRGVICISRLPANSSQSGKQKSVQWNQPGASICGLYLCTSPVTFGRDEFLGLRSCLLSAPEKKKGNPKYLFCGHDEFSHFIHLLQHCYNLLVSVHVPDDVFHNWN